MTDHKCMTCDAGLVSDEIALHRKLYGRSCQTYMCLDCQAKYLNTTRSHLEKIIEQYHRRGNCVLFAKW